MKNSLSVRRSRRRREMAAVIAVVVAFLAMLSSAGGAQAPAPAPRRQRSSPVPMQQLAPTQEAAPEPTPYTAPPEGSVAPEPTPYKAPPEGSVAPEPTPYMGSPGLAPLPPCFTEVLNLTDCLSYVQSGSNLTSPDKGCCPELAGLIESSPVCLCQLFGNANSFGIKLDTARALKLPSACQISAPPLSACALLGIPVAAPASDMPAPAGMSPSVAPSQIASAPESSMSSSSFSISLPVPVFLTGLWGVLSLIS